MTRKILHLCFKMFNFNAVDFAFRNISPSQNPSVAIFALGEGWHNYHVRISLKILK